MEEIREIPEGWEEKEIKELFKVASGDLLSSNDMMFGKYPVYGGNGICGYNNSYNSDTSKIIIGRVGVYCGCIYKTEDKSWITDNALYIKNKLWNYQEEFMFYKLKHIDLNKYADKNAQPLISGSKIYGIKIKIPKSKKEQQKISTILSTLDQNIEKTEQTIEKYIKIKNSLMDDLLTGKRKIKDGKWVVETEFKEVDDIGRVPKDWEVKKIGTISKFIKDGTHGTHEDFENGIPLLSAKDVYNGKVNIPADCRKISLQDYKLIHKNYELIEDDILLTIVGTIGRTAIITDSFNKYTFQRSVGIIRLLKDYCSKYFYYYISFYRYQKQLELRVTASAQGGIYLGSLSNTIVCFPKQHEQVKIANILSKQDQLIEKEQQYLQKLKSLKSGLMEDLLTGKVRVK